ncbi:cryptochrome/photolyase family protein [Thalassobaculum sp. OXR-137]|uniref:cryptochrome/photolyase family protein n=1 Tax=Thalassobaculum sp. OXR-137 TaxID=3100173 RepID=UPI002AC8A3BC|nr:cryptochrome/photolyase family protein [Thalassobaculum sp. OXR-137]WPZ36874.1 cryptochrome/photolyase family protein [Thalassobaculum sp. OXR-137]
MTVLRVVLGDQLDRQISSLTDLDRDADVVLMMEVTDETTYVPHHPKKIALILSAMRHFSAALEAEGATVDYVRLDASQNTGSFTGEVDRAVKRHKPKRIVVTEPGEWRVEQDVKAWEQAFGLPVEIRADDRFLCSRAEFADWAKGRKMFRMEHFYREMRKRTGILMDGDDPVGGEWNFDKENRKPLPKGIRAPNFAGVAPDEITEPVLALVAERFADNFGDLDGFRFPVTRDQALGLLDRFIARGLKDFGDYQDAMALGEPFLFHSLISPALNIGLLRPREVIERVEAAYRAGVAPLNAAEGFIRQILGWREYVRGIYWHAMPEYAETNAFGADRPLPALYWTGETDMRCLAEVVGQTRREAYAHHIQRLMVTGCFALLIGADPDEVNAWYLAVYADAFEWVQLPNTHGMVLHADGGMLGSKPYAASGKYIDRMSDYCGTCRYDVKQTAGETACPFNALYWRFLDRNAGHLRDNRRMAMIYRTWDRFDDDRRAAILARADRFLETLD